MGLKTLRGLPRKLANAQHNRRIGGIVRTPPAITDAQGPIYAGMTCHRDVLSWLVAVKSVARAVGPGSYAVVDDGTLTHDDAALLSAQLPGLHILPIRSIDTHGCPRGGAWERLMAVLELCVGNYVIQVDSDLVALSPLEEVADAVRQGRGFTLSGEAGVTLTSLEAATAAARRHSYQHVQPDTERLLADMPDADGLYYVRGCAGFAGFPKGTDRALAVSFSTFMQARLGAGWTRWGSEQVTSNFVVANTANLVVLPWAAYPAFNGVAKEVASAKLIHFIGPTRFKGGVYTRASRAAIAQLYLG